jgi:dimethylglycine dehydrogenase
MKSHVRVAVIGGGVVGCSVLYHLTKLGWRDVALLERKELTSGSTWHAAGGFHTLNGDPNIARLQGYTIKLYKEIEAISGVSCGLHQVGGLAIASTPERMDFIRAEAAKQQYMGLDSYMVGLDEIRRICPLMDVTGVLGGLYDPNDGHLDPSGTTNAYAAAARKQGAEIYRNTRVTDLRPRSDGAWDVVTEEGTIVAEHVVNAGGLWAREINAMAGVYLPILPMEHQYILTDQIEAVAALTKELPQSIDLDGESYMRQEGKTILLGVYEHGCKHWSLDGTPWDFGHELIAPDLDRMLEKLEVGFRRYPCLKDAGIRRIINGGMVFAPDGNPLVGPVPGMHGYWVACGVMAGFSQGGGVGLTLAEWMIEGEPSADVFGMDVARFSSWCSPGYTIDKTRENYQRRFALTFPNEHMPAGRPYKTTAAYDALKAENAVFGVARGLEHALYFAPKGETAAETPSFRRSNAFDTVAAECRAVREAVGLLEIANFAKYTVEGPGAEAWLSNLLANRMPREGRIVLTPMLSPKGRIIGDFTLAKTGPERFMLVGSYGAQDYHMRWFLQQLPESNGGVAVHNVTDAVAGFSIAGPKARELLSRLTRTDVSNVAFPFLSARWMDVGRVPAIVSRISYTGELGYEIYAYGVHQRALYETLREAGADLGLRPIGFYALNSLRLEKSFGAWSREYTPDYTPAMNGLARFVDLRKNAFIGRDAAQAASETPPAHRLAALVVDADGADVWGYEPVRRKDDVVGFVTSGGYAHHTGKSVALAYLKPEAFDGPGLTIEILGAHRPATIAPEPLYDPSGARMRS